MSTCNYTWQQCDNYNQRKTMKTGLPAVLNLLLKKREKGQIVVHVHMFFCELFCSVHAAWDESSVTLDCMVYRHCRLCTVFSHATNKILYFSAAVRLPCVLSSFSLFTLNVITLKKKNTCEIGLYRLPEETVDNCVYGIVWLTYLNFKVVHILFTY